VRRYQLQDWPEDRLPLCSNSACGCVIENGQWYGIPDETTRILCLGCSTDTQTIQVVRAEYTEAARQLLPKTKQRKPRQPRPPAAPRRRQPAASRANLKRGKPFKYPGVPCRSCGQEFQPTAHGRTRTVYCSVACFAEGRRTRSLIQTCPACDQTFMPKHGRPQAPQVCCSRSCARYWFQGGRRNPAPRPVMWSSAWGLMGCRNCGRSDRKHRGQGYCPACYRRLRNPPSGARKQEPKRGLGSFEIVSNGAISVVDGGSDATSGMEEGTYEMSGEAESEGNGG